MCFIEEAARILAGCLCAYGTFSPRGRTKTRHGSLGGTDFKARRIPLAASRAFLKIDPTGATRPPRQGSLPEKRSASADSIFRRVLELRILICHVRHSFPSKLKREREKGLEISVPELQSASYYAVKDTC